MLVELYVDALIADEEAADAVWALWGAGVITDEIVSKFWAIIAASIEVLRDREGRDRCLIR
jgi:hypothetical protein